jgi:phytoene dehydrogenase-like protein
VEARLIGTPRTFARYTHRARGRVGGVPSTFSALLHALPPVTPFENLYLVGDTVYPGQGIPAVVLGALNVADRIAARGAG